MPPRLRRVIPQRLCELAQRPGRLSTLRQVMVVATREVVAQLLEPARSRPPGALACLADEAQLRARIARLLDDLVPHRKVPDALDGPQHHAGPVEVVATVAERAHAVSGGITRRSRGGIAYCEFSSDPARAPTYS